ncbi:MAG: cob(I)yrinic acid a,c-diamide adenosyltransferase [Actinomycetota bacterium]
MKIYTKRGDDGSTGLFFGGRVAKDSPRPTAYGAVDEAQAAIGVARAATSDAGLDELLIVIGRDLYVAMAELATGVSNSDKLVAGQTLMVQTMVDRLEAAIDETSERFEMPTEFVVPGGSVVSAALDVARTVVRRAERESLSVAVEESLVVPYLNRLSDLLWALARWQENSTTPSRTAT